MAGIHRQDGFNFTTFVEKATRVHHIVYNADAETWTCLWDLSWGQREIVRNRTKHEAHRCAVAVWNTNSFALRGLRIGMRLSYLEHFLGERG